MQSESDYLLAGRNCDLCSEGSPQTESGRACLELLKEWAAHVVVVSVSGDQQHGRRGNGCLCFLSATTFGEELVPVVLQHSVCDCMCIFIEWKMPT